MPCLHSALQYHIVIHIEAYHGHKSEHYSGQAQVKIDCEEGCESMSHVDCIGEVGGGRGKIFLPLFHPTLGLLVGDCVWIIQVEDSEWNSQASSGYESTAGGKHPPASLFSIQVVVVV